MPREFSSTATASSIPIPVKKRVVDLKEIGLLVVAGLVLWRVAIVNVGDYFAEEGGPESARQALNWNAGQPKALAEVALQQTTVAGTSAAKSLAAAAQANPADGRIMAAMAQDAHKAKADELAGRAMLAATTMAPQRTDVSLAAYRFWLAHDNPGQALQAANVALTREPELAESMYPQLLLLMRHPQADEAFAGLLKSRVRWWPGFFGYVAAQAPNAEVVRALYSMQLQGPNAFERQQLQSYLARLQRDGQWLDAYLVWLNSLPADAMSFSGELHNGGFEEASRNLGFEWLNQAVPGVMVGFDSTYGTTGAKALHVVFQGTMRTYWRHFNQYLMLAPGEYTLRGRVRIDSLLAERGVEWLLACNGAAEPLATTDRFKGTDQWRYFVVPFVVPENGCPVQDLRLELVGRSALDFEASGQIWFDDLAVQRK
jgi:hypothetical protein